MTKRMLIDATHAEETRVVVLDGNRLEDFDVETSTKKQLKGNIYLAKVVRVEPSLQAAFVEYGGGRHGFLAFGEIHPDYYQIPVADRQRLLELQAEEARAEAEAEDREVEAPQPAEPVAAAEPVAPEPAPAPPAVEEAVFGELSFGKLADGAWLPAADMPAALEEHDLESPAADLPPPEVVGGESDPFEGNGAEEARARRSARFLRNYRIQEVIRRRQIMLVQVVKEERGTKGAALTTYISLAGRFCVLMPNSPRGGGISRKITSANDRRRLKEITSELEIPQGMGLIVRTAGANRPKPEIKRDCEYLMRLWDEIRELTLRSVAPALIYEEASLIKRAIRDVYSRDVDEILVDGEDGWHAAHEFMRMLMPSHAKKVQHWRNGGQPLFSKMGVEQQLDAMLAPTVQLRSGGYLVINQTEALVAIDVNSGRATRERGIEETALRTNLEAADEAARQLRLRDLAGLIVIDFIDMEARKHNGMVERRMKEALKNDRARIQLGHISHFGLLEMSRQRLRPSLAETSLIVCPHCRGLGHVRSVESSAIHVLRGIEEEGSKARASLIMVHCAEAIMMYIVNHKRDRLGEIEARFAMQVQFAADPAMPSADFRIERLRGPVAEAERPAAAPVAATVVPAEEFADEPDVEAEDAPEGEAAEPTADAAAEARASADDGGRRRRRRRRRGGRRDGAAGEPEAPRAAAAGDEAEPGDAEPEAAEPAPDLAGAEQPEIETAELDENGLPRSRRRGRRGGRRRGRREGPFEAEPVAAEPAPRPYAGPTPADPFGPEGFDIFDMMEEAEQPPARPKPVEAVVPEPAPMPEPAEATAAAPVPEPGPALVAEVVVEPEPAGAVEPEPAFAAAEPEPAGAVVEEHPPEPAVRPIVIGKDALPEQERKRGWWRR
jgi:ribonuclease E